MNNLKSTDWSKPSNLDDPTVVFGCEPMPDYGDIPEEFRRHNGTKWNAIQSRWFYEGLPKGTEFKPKHGIDSNAALRHLKSIQGSFAPKHEHKEAAVAYLMSLWFDDVLMPEDKSTT